jgi:hypothetical protein
MDLSRDRLILELEYGNIFQAKSEDRNERLHYYKVLYSEPFIWRKLIMFDSGLK